MTLDDEIKKIAVKKKLTLTIPVLTSTAGGYLGNFFGNVVTDYNSSVDNIEKQFQQVLTHYQIEEANIEKKIDDIPGLSLWKKGQEVLFGKAQEYTGLRNMISSDSTQTLVQVNPEDLSFQGIKFPESSMNYSLLGLSIGLAYGIIKVGNRLRRLGREQKILKMVK